MKKSQSKVASNNKSKKYLRTSLYIGAALVACAVVASGVSYGPYAKWHDSNKIVPHYYVQGEDIGGLTPEVAKQNLETRFGRLFVTLHAPDRDFHVSLSQLGGKLEYDYAVEQARRYGRRGNLVSNMWQYWFSSEKKKDVLPLRWNEEQLRKTMWTIAYTYNQAPQDATLKVTPAAVQIVAERPGRGMDVTKSIQTIRQKYFPGLSSVTIQGKLTAPQIHAAQLQGEDVMLGKYTTSFNPGVRGRTANVRLAAKALSGRVLMPGNTFSFNKTTGERTPAKGYQVAKIFVKMPGESASSVVDGVGGGVCQVSSTLYNAVLRTKNDAKNTNNGNLKIVERNHHSLPVTYVPSGMDATVAWPYKDFRFRNKYPFPVYLKTAVSGSKLTIAVWGRVPYGDTARLTSVNGSSLQEDGEDS